MIASNLSSGRGWGAGTRVCAYIYEFAPCSFKYVCLCMMCILIRLHLNMWEWSIKLCVSPCVSVSARACRDTCLGITGNRAGDMIRRWVFPNAVLSARWRGGIQMTCVQLWQTRSLEGNHHRCVCVWLRESVSLASSVPICTHDCVCVSQIHAKSLFASRAPGPKNYYRLC